MEITYKQRYEIHKQCKDFIKVKKKYVIGKVIITIVLLFLGLISPVFYKMMIDDVLYGKEVDRLFIVCLGVIGTFLIKSYTSYMELKINNQIKWRIGIRTKDRLWKNLLYSRISFTDQYETGDLLKRLDEDSKVLEDYYLTQEYNYAALFVNVVALYAVLIVIDFRFALITMLIIPMVNYSKKVVGKKIQEKSEKYRVEYGKYTNWLAERISDWKDTKVLNASEMIQDRFTKVWDQVSKHFIQSQKYMILNSIIHNFSYQCFMQLSLYFVGIILIYYSDFTIGTLLIYIAYFKKATNNINKMNSLDIDLMRQMASIKRVCELLNIKCERKKQIRELNGSIEFQHVSFAYNEQQKNVLNDISFHMKDKQHIAIVGASGEGKTTILKLILGIMKPQTGLITIQGIDIKELTEDDIFSNTAAILQGMRFFNFSIMDNLKLINYKASDEKIIDACKRTRIHDFIESLPEKYDTIIGENGIKLSGGQRQRLNMARMLLLDRNILLLDEATNEIDQIEESAIFNELKEELKERTMIFITHRRSTLQWADKILVIKDGNIVGFDILEELQKSNIAFQQLFNVQE